MSRQSARIARELREAAGALSHAMADTGARRPSKARGGAAARAFGSPPVETIDANGAVKAAR